MSNSQTNIIRINPDLIKKIKQVIQNNPKADETKITQLCQNDANLRLKKEVIKSGVNQYFRKYVKKPEDNALQNVNGSEKTINDATIDLTLQALKKKVKKTQFTFEFQDNQKYKFQSLGGIADMKEQIDNSLFQYVNNKNLYKQISSASLNKGYLISGSVGSGKTILANCILSEIKKKGYNCYFVNSLQLIGNDADDKFKKLFEVMEDKIPSALCIDDIQQLCSKEANKRSQGSSINTLCLYMDRFRYKECLFIATTSNPQKLDTITKPGRYYKSYKIMNPTEEQRSQILLKKLMDLKYALNEAEISEIVKLTSGYVAVDLVSFIDEALNKCVKRLLSDSNLQKVLILQDFKAASSSVQPVLKRQGFAKIPTTKLSDIGALEHIKEALINEIILPMRSRQKFRKLNFQITGGGVLLYGPPGCGKTMLAKGIANQANVNFITVKGPQLLTKYVGQSEEAVRKVFERARSCAPSVIFFDEFDALAPKRQDSGNQVTERVVNTLLNELNGIDDRKMIFVIAATNRPDIIDEAVLRSGRIELKLEVPMPSLSDRQKILSKIISNIGKQEAIDVKLIASRTEMFSGADLAYLVKKSIISAVAGDREGIKNQDLLDAIKSFKTDNVFGKKPELIVQQQQHQNEQYSYHPLEQLKPKKLESNQQEGVDNEPQRNIKGKNHEAEGILHEFISFLVHKSKSVQRKQKI